MAVITWKLGDALRVDMKQAEGYHNPSFALFDVCDSTVERYHMPSGCCTMGYNFLLLGNLSHVFTEKAQNRLKNVE